MFFAIMPPRIQPPATLQAVFYLHGRTTPRMGEVERRREQPSSVCRSLPAPACRDTSHFHVGRERAKFPERRPHTMRVMTEPAFPPELLRDVAKRRTFAIISHPDAGKTTLTEKLLLFGGAIQMAGTVKAR